MAAKSKLDGMSREIADRAKAVFGGIVNDLDGLFRKLGDRIGNGSATQRADLLKVVRALRKSLDARLGALERLVEGSATTRASAPRKKRTTAARKGPVKNVSARRR